MPELAEFFQWITLFNPLNNPRKQLLVQENRFFREVSNLPTVTCK